MVQGNIYCLVMNFANSKFIFCFLYSRPWWFYFSKFSQSLDSEPQCLYYWKPKPEAVYCKFGCTEIFADNMNQQSKGARQGCLGRGTIWVVRRAKSECFAAVCDSSSRSSVLRLLIVSVKSSGNVIEGGGQRVKCFAVVTSPKSSILPDCSWRVRTTLVSLLMERHRWPGW